MRGRLFPAEGAGTGTDTSSGEVTRTLNRIVCPIGHLATAIGASEFMREEPKKKMLVKNSTTDMSDATVGLLTAVAKHVVPDLPPPEQIHYKVNPASERRDRLNRFAGRTEGALGVVDMITQGTDIPSMNVVLDWDAPIGKPTRVIEMYVYSRRHTQFVGRPCRKDSKNPAKTCWHHCLPGVELETEEIASKQQLVELLKTMRAERQRHNGRQHQAPSRFRRQVRGIRGHHPRRVGEPDTRVDARVDARDPDGSSSLGSATSRSATQLPLKNRARLSRGRLSRVGDHQIVHGGLATWLGRRLEGWRPWGRG